MKLGNAEITVSPEDINQAVENYLNQVCFRESAAVQVLSVDKSYEKWVVKTAPKPGLNFNAAPVRLGALPLVPDSGIRSPQQ